jgi:hypothetical protein
VTGVKLDPTPREVRVFGLLWLAFFGALGGVVLWRPRALVGAAAILGTAWLLSLVFNREDRLLQLAGVLLPAVFGLIGLDVTVGYVEPLRVALVLSIAGVAGAAAIWVAPRLGRLLYVGWMLAALPLGWTISRVVLGAVYYAVLTPVGWALRVAGYDPLRRGFDPTARTYWIERKRQSEPSRYFRQF